MEDFAGVFQETVVVTWMVSETYSNKICQENGKPISLNINKITRDKSFYFQQQTEDLDYHSYEEWRIMESVVLTEVWGDRSCCRDMSRAVLDA